MLTKNEVREITDRIKTSKIGIIGDFCVDIYWHADMTLSELSRETPHYPLPVTSEKTSMGAGGNVAANLAALRPAKIYAISLVGDDWRGMLLRSLIKKSGISDEYIIETEGRFTNAYCKPMRHGISATVYEDPRLDFENREPINEDTENKVIEYLRSLSKKVDVLCVADQFRYGIVTDNVRKEIISLAKKGLTVICDSRYNIGEYTDCILKPNEVECWRAVYGNDGFVNASEEEFLEAAKALAVKNNAKVFCTLGSKGSFVTDGKIGIRVGAKTLTGELDICGAGDTSLSAFSLGITAGTEIDKAAALAGLASAVTVKKIGMTGTATAEEIYNIAD
ncbi:MAG: sugar kinase [Clostridia bacterium]|nr:sugar kinase [Clostridia bacterium]